MPAPRHNSVELQAYCAITGGVWDVAHHLAVRRDALTGQQIDLELRPAIDAVTLLNGWREERRSHRCNFLARSYWQAPLCHHCPSITKQHDRLRPISRTREGLKRWWVAGVELSH
jgi:hypothetical protein